MEYCAYKILAIFVMSNNETHTTKMTGTEKQIAWATDILATYTAARAEVMTKVASAPAANQPVILAAIAKIDARYNDRAYAGDIIARGAVTTKGLMEAIMTIANGGETVLDCK